MRILIWSMKILFLNQKPCLQWKKHILGGKKWAKTRSCKSDSYNLSQKSETAFFISIHNGLILSINSNIFSPFSWKPYPLTNRCLKFLSGCSLSTISWLNNTIFPNGGLDDKTWPLLDKFCLRSRLRIQYASRKE